MRNKVILTDVDGVLLDWSAAFTGWMTEVQGFTLNSDYDPTQWDISTKFYDDRGNIVSRNLCFSMVRTFNESANIGFLHPVLGAITYVNELANQGYRFVALTSMTNDTAAAKLRHQNLVYHFGPVFDEVNCIDLGMSKYNDLQILAQKHPGAYWLEDNIDNHADGVDCGLEGLLVKQPYNAHHEDSHDWGTIYTKITQNVRKYRR